MKDITEPLTEAEEEEIFETLDSWIQQLVTTPTTELQERFSPTEMAEFARDMASKAALKAELEMFEYGHPAVFVGYPIDYNVAQHPVHQRLQKEYEMVTIDSRTIENGPEAYDHQVTVYMHRSDYDDAVLSGAMDVYFDR